MPSEREEALKLEFEDLRRENERLRDARSEITRQLGPLPISAAIVAGLVSGFTVDGKAHLNPTLAHLALGVFAAMVVVSIISSLLAPYRKLRDRVERQRTAGTPADAKSPHDAETPTEWYERMIEVERQIRGQSKTYDHPMEIAVRLLTFPLGMFRRTENLQIACDREWTGLFVTKLLFVAVIALLILARTEATGSPTLTSCLPAHAHQRAMDRFAVVYQGRDPRGRAELVACSRTSGQRLSLGALETGSDGSRGKVIAVALAGPIVGYGGLSPVDQDGHGAPGEVIVVRDLRTGMVLHRVSVGAHSGPSVPRLALARLVVTSTGAAAWITEDSRPRDREVWAVDRSGTRRLARGAEIAPESLALAGHTVSWLRRGRAERYVLR